MYIFHGFFVNLSPALRMKCPCVLLCLGVKFISIFLLSVSLLAPLFSPQVESSLHKDHVVRQWRDQISEKEQVGRSTQLLRFNSVKFSNKHLRIRFLFNIFVFIVKNRCAMLTFIQCFALRVYIKKDKFFM